MTRGPYSLIPDSMRPEVLAAKPSDWMDWNLLRGIFAAHEAKYVSREALIEAISDWQITSAKEALGCAS